MSHTKVRGRLRSIYKLLHPPKATSHLHHYIWQNLLDMTVSSRWHVSCRLMLWLQVIPWWRNTRWHILEDLSYCIMLMHTWVAWLYNMLNWLTQTILPQIDLWILKMDRGSSAYVQLRVLCSNYSIWSLWTGYSILVQMICWSLLPQMIVDEYDCIV